MLERNDNNDGKSESGLYDDLSASHLSLIDKSPTNGRIVSVYFCGTCSNKGDYNNYKRYFNGENVSHTYSITEGNEYIDKIIVNGPGNDIDDKSNEYYQSDIDNLWVPYTPYKNSDGIIYGSGLNERIQHVLAVLKNEPTKELTNAASIEAHKKLKIDNINNPIKRVNIVGWSRGGAAAIETASRMSSDPLLKDIEVNLILLDPVPGIGLSTKLNRKLTSNVKNCYCIYATDERSACFSPVMPEIPEGCNHYVTFLPGGHAQVAGDETDHAGKPIAIEGVNLHDVGILSRIIIHQALHNLGTKLDINETLKLTLSDTIEYYKNCKENSKYYAEIATRVPYTVSQMQGNERKVIDGDANWLNQYIGTVRNTRFPQHDPEYIDHIHHQLVLVVDYANTHVEKFCSYLNEQLNSQQILESNTICEEARNIFATNNSAAVLYRAFSEALQVKLKPDDLLNLDNRCNNQESLDAYVFKLVEAKVAEHNQSIYEKQKETEQHEQDERNKEQERIEQERLEQERVELEKARVENERIEKERLEQERLEQERLEQERLEQERVELEKARVENERIEKERLEQERIEQERVEKERIEKEQKEIQRKLIQELKDAAQKTEDRIQQIANGIQKIEDKTNNLYQETKQAARRIWLGVLIGSLIGFMTTSIPAALIIAGVILSPATFGASGALVGIGIGLLVTGTLIGGSVGAWIGSRQDKRVNSPKKPDSKGNNTHSLLNLQWKPTTSLDSPKQSNKNEELPQHKSSNSSVPFFEGNNGTPPVQPKPSNNNNSNTP